MPTAIFAGKIFTIGTTLGDFFDDCTRRLKLTTAARRAFLSDGREIFEVAHLEKGDVVIVSCGEPFRPKEIHPGEQDVLWKELHKLMDSRERLSMESDSKSPDPVLYSGGSPTTTRERAPTISEGTRDRAPTMTTRERAPAALGDYVTEHVQERHRGTTQWLRDAGNAVRNSGVATSATFAHSDARSGQKHSHNAQSGRNEQIQQIHQARLPLEPSKGLRRVIIRISL